MTKFAVIDGQGGGIGKATVARLRSEFGDNIEIVVLGTNSLATGNMLKSGANAGATGENAVVVNVRKADVIVGPMAILMANSLMGEITPKMAEAVVDSCAKKFIIPLNLCNVHIIGSRGLKLSEALDQLIDEIRQFMVK